MPAELIVLAEAADRAQSRWQKAAAARGLRLERASAGEGGVVLCAGSDLDRALDALVENAILYSQRGSEVVIADGPGTIEVLDRGPGLGQDEQQAVFERFYRGSAGRRGPAGTGLGLPIARELAAGWGGAVTISNRAGGGARAVLELPLAPATVGAGR